MPARAWHSAEEEDDNKEDLAGALECYTRELGVLCDGLEVQQFEAEGEDLDEKYNVGADTLASLEEMTAECAALLGCLETGDKTSDDDEELNSVIEDLNINKNQQKLQEEESNETARREELAHELNSFADELNDVLSRLGEPSPAETVCATAVSAASELADATSQSSEKMRSIGSEENPNCDSAPVTVLVRDIKNVVATTADTNSFHVFSERTQKAMTSHVKRLAMRSQTHHVARSRHQVSTKADTNEQNTGVKGNWLSFHSTSVQQHIMRQKFARRRVKQVQEAQLLVEAARLKRSKIISYRHSKASEDQFSKQTTQHATYLDQFRSNLACSSTVCGNVPQYLCAVYLYGLRRLGTTFVTFISFVQLEQRVRTRFAIREVVGIYREVTEAVVPESAFGNGTNRLRRVKRLQRLSTLEHVHDGDTLCITQNAYDDMTILCDWIKLRQRVVHGFQYEVHQPTDVTVTLPNEGLAPLQPKICSSAVNKPQLWDSNGRSIGVKAQHPI